MCLVPCLPNPNSFAAAVQCENDSASVSWAWSDGAKSYELTATSGTGAQLKCSTTQNSCNITYLECGQTYSLSLTASNTAGAVSMETGITFQSRKSNFEDLRYEIKRLGSSSILYNLNVLK
ncbi:MAG: fibronectin type III domain-containing protein [Gammaproteobacteria bacterium]